LKVLSANWLEKHDFPCFCRVFEDSAGQSRYRYQHHSPNLLPWIPVRKDNTCGKAPWEPKFPGCRLLGDGITDAPVGSVVIWN